MKFKVGDKVRVVKIHDDSACRFECEGQTFTIRQINPNTPYSKNEKTHYGVVEPCGWIFYEDELELVEPDTFTKADLKDGMVVEYRDGDRFLVVKDHLLSKDYCADMSDLGDDLKDIYGFSADDIVKVYEVDYDYADEFEELFDLVSLKLIWERDKEEPVKEMTVEEIEKKLGYKVKVIADK